MNIRFVLSVIGAAAVLASCTSATSSTNQSNSVMDMGSMTMSAMDQSLQGKTGDDFDKAFIEAMIPHHQGAIDMAKQALQNAKHQEIKNMAQNIISSQQQEINQMRQWEALWGYMQ